MSQVSAIKFAHPVLHRLRSLWPSQLFRHFVPTGPVEWTLLISITLLSAWLMHMMLPLTLPFEFPAIFGYDILPTPDKVYEWSNIRHPLRSVLTYPLSIPFHLSGERYFAIQYSVCVAYGYAILFLYRIILSAGGRNIPYALLSVALFLSFGHSEILMFAPDTFSFSMSLLSLAFLWIWMKKEKNVVADNLLMALIAGMTVTNSLKLGILFLFTEKGFIKGLRRFLRALPLFIILSLPYIWTDIIPMLEKPGETSLMSIQYTCWRHAGMGLLRESDKHPAHAVGQILVRAIVAASDKADRRGTGLFAIAIQFTISQHHSGDFTPVYHLFDFTEWQGQDSVDDCGMDISRPDDCDKI